MGSHEAVPDIVVAADGTMAGNTLTGQSIIDATNAEGPKWGHYVPKNPEEVRTVSSTGGAKGVKPERYDLLPVEALDIMARLYGFGAQKYAAHNWRKGYEWSKSYASLMRHATRFWAGEDIDEETGLPHLAGVSFHAFTLMVFMTEHPDFDDRFTTQHAIDIAKIVDKINENQIPSPWQTPVGDQYVYSVEDIDIKFPDPNKPEELSDVVPVQPEYNRQSNRILIPATPGVVYTIDNTVVTGSIYKPAGNCYVEAFPLSGFRFLDSASTEWLFQ